MNTIIDHINTTWDNDIIPTLIDYIKIPNKSPHFDADWEKHGYMDQAVNIMVSWCKKNAAKGMQLEVIRHPGKTPLIYIDIPGDSEETILLYGHLDKQPEMQGWDHDLGPWKPVLREDKLYGRGGADDGYAIFAALTAVNAVQKQGKRHARCIILIEASEESGSVDLPYYIDALQEKIGHPTLIICLDSGCGNYDQLWITTSLRGLISGTLTIAVLSQGLHSGHGSGVVPSCSRILRQLLDRIEDEKTGNILLDSLQVDIPALRLTQITKAAQQLGNNFRDSIPFLSGVHADSDSTAELLLRRTWQPALAVIGIDGIPSIADAGNVTLPSLSVKLSIRLPPTCNATHAATALKKALEEKPPYGAHVSFTIDDTNTGWHAPLEAPWLQEAATQASQTYFGSACAYQGEGASIPFMGMLGKKFPQAQFLITGVLGPQSNAHGPNEFLHIPTAKKITACIADIISKQYEITSSRR